MTTKIWVSILALAFGSWFYSSLCLLLAIGNYNI